MTINVIAIMAEFLESLRYKRIEAYSYQEIPRGSYHGEFILDIDTQDADSFVVNPCNEIPLSPNDYLRLRSHNGHYFSFEYEGQGKIKLKRATPIKGRKSTKKRRNSVEWTTVDLHHPSSLDKIKRIINY